MFFRCLIDAQDGGGDPSSSESNDPDFDDVQCSQMPSVDTEAAFSDHEVESKVSILFQSLFVRPLSLWCFLFFMFIVPRTINLQILMALKDITSFFLKL
jgi:hypothetical protein